MKTNHRRTVLVVDDEPVIRLVALHGLEDAGFEAVEAESADVALTILRDRTDVGVLFTDVNMPGQIDGMQLAKLVHARWPGIRIVLTSGRALTEPVPEDGKFMEKPYTVDQLTDVIEAINTRAH